MLGAFFCPDARSGLGGIWPVLLVAGRGASPFTVLRYRSGFEPTLRHLQKNPVLPVAARGFSPMQALVCELSVFLR